jgi:hypothetical protein
VTGRVDADVVVASQEVSCFGENGKGDTGDDWDVQCKGAVSEALGTSRMLLCP